MRQIVAIILLAAGPAACGGPDSPFAPISPEELAYQGPAEFPDEHAVILFREHVIDDSLGVEIFHYRIKILTETGRQYGDVRIPYLRGQSRVNQIQARTIRPDGSEIPFSGAVFEVTVLRQRKLKLEAKVFSMPAVEPGGIIEYRYQLEPGFGRSEWEIQHELFTRKARFHFKPMNAILPFAVRRVTSGMSATPSSGPFGDTLSLENVPPLRVDEEHVPPRNVITPHVRFFYEYVDRPPDDEPEWRKAILKSQPSLPTKDVEALLYWIKLGAMEGKALSEFASKNRTIQAAVNALIRPEDPPEEKLRKIYGAVRKIRNIDFDMERTQKEVKREDLKEARSIEDVWKRQYGTHDSITALFVVMAESAGLPAMVVKLTERDRMIFHPYILSPDQLNGYAAMVRLPLAGSHRDGTGAWRYFDPATPFCPFGMLPWEKTGTKGVRLIEKPEDLSLAATPDPRSDEARVVRKAEVELNADGSAKGTLTVTWEGRSGADLRLRGMHSDFKQRQEMIEKRLGGWLSGNCQVAVKSVEGWREPESPLQGQFVLYCRDFAIATKNRLLAPASLAQVGGARWHDRPHRVFDVYFQYPSETRDELLIRLPEGFSVEGLPQRLEKSTQAGSLEQASEIKEGRLEHRRRFVLNRFFLPADQWANVYDLFGAHRRAGEQYVSLRRKSHGE